MQLFRLLPTLRGAQPPVWLLSSPLGTLPEALSGTEPSLRSFQQSRRPPAPF